eukprot:3544453-Amphidinium_carterae.1
MCKKLAKARVLVSRSALRFHVVLFVYSFGEIFSKIKQTSCISSCLSRERSTRSLLPDVFCAIAMASDTEKFQSKTRNQDRPTNDNPPEVL